MQPGIFYLENTGPTKYLRWVEHTCIQSDSQSASQSVSGSNSQTNRQTDSQSDSQTDRETERQRAFFFCCWFFYLCIKVIVWPFCFSSTISSSHPQSLNMSKSWVSWNVLVLSGKYQNILSKWGKYFGRKKHRISIFVGNIIFIR